MIIKSSDPGCLNILTRILGEGGVAILKCDTIYGFVGIVPETEARISSIKGRKKGKPYVQLLGEPGWIRHYSDIVLSPRIAALWPGPLTLIIPLKEGGTLGVRVPDDTFLINILTTIQKPIYSTSVNREGQEPLNNINDIVSEFEDEVDIIVDSGNSIETIASTILDLTSKPYQVIRSGKLIIPRELLL
ncbi:MAG: L-threonylcarbamoyladenylate synthase [Spirochaetales bacterium]|nr:L-threonylcarbamoyladenylate synthase [Spirochaetales bacterium]